MIVRSFPVSFKNGNVRTVNIEQCNLIGTGPLQRVTGFFAHLLDGNGVRMYLTKQGPFHMWTYTEQKKTIFEFIYETEEAIEKVYSKLRASIDFDLGV